MNIRNAMASFIRKNSIIINGLCLPLILAGVVATFSFMVKMSGDVGAVRSAQTMAQQHAIEQTRSLGAALDRLRTINQNQDDRISENHDLTRDNAQAIKNHSQNLHKLDQRVNQLEQWRNGKTR